jgi:hypothetical protein
LGARLADLFDHEPELFTERKIKSIVHRRKGNTRERFANSKITKFVWDKVKSGEGVDAAIIETGLKFKKERSWLYELWAKHKRALELAEAVREAPPKKRALPHLR